MRDEKLYLIDMVQAADAVERFLDGVSESDFVSNELVQSAVVNKLGIIGEAAAHISENIKNKYPNVVWKSVTGF